MKLVNIKAEHLDELVKIVNNTWNFEEYGIKPDENLKFSILDLYDCLSRSNFAKVMVENNKPIGFLLGRDYSKPKDESRHYLKSKAKEVEESLRSSKNYLLLKEYEKMYVDVNKSLKHLVNKQFDSELVLFAVDNNHKGKGLGRALLDDFESYLLENKLHSLYVYTDTSCNYKFYDNNGFNKLKTLKRNPKLKNYADMEFYIYSKTL